MWQLLLHLLTGRYYLSDGNRKHRMTVWDIGNPRTQYIAPRPRRILEVAL